MKDISKDVARALEVAENLGRTINEAEEYCVSAD